MPQKQSFHLFIQQRNVLPRCGQALVFQQLRTFNQELHTLVMLPKLCLPPPPQHQRHLPPSCSADRRREGYGIQNVLRARILAGWEIRLGLPKKELMATCYIVKEEGDMHIQAHQWIGRLEATDAKTSFSPEKTSRCPAHLGYSRSGSQA